MIPKWLTTSAVLLWPSILITMRILLPLWTKDCQEMLEDWILARTKQEPLQQDNLAREKYATPAF